MNKLEVISSVVGDNEVLLRSCADLWDEGEAKLFFLYGDSYSEVIAKCLAVSPYFCFQVVTNIYAIWWNLDGVSDYDRSLVTCGALLASGRVQQFQVLVNTFLHTGGSQGKLAAILIYMRQQDYIDSDTLAAIEIEKSEATIDLSEAELFFIDMACMAAKAKDITAILAKVPEGYSKQQLVKLMNHLLTYIGCPLVWDGTMQLNNFLIEKE